MSAAPMREWCEAIEWHQEMHCCAPTDGDEGVLRLQVQDGGGGRYVVINATEWAIDSLKDIENLTARIRAMMEDSEWQA